MDTLISHFNSFRFNSESYFFTKNRDGDYTLISPEETEDIYFEVHGIAKTFFELYINNLKLTGDFLEEVSRKYTVEKNQVALDVRNFLERLSNKQIIIPK